jgi:hypothetical protein
MTKQFSHKAILAKLGLCCALLIMAFSSSAQVLKNATKTSFIKDSLIAVGSKDFVYNALTIQNTSSTPLELQLRISIPEGWQLTTQQVVNVTVEANNSAIVPLRLYPALSNSAQWQKVRIDYRSVASGEMETASFNVKMKEIAGFRATLPNSAMVLPSYQRNIAIPVYIKNTGNLDGHYTITSRNRFLHLDDKTELDVKAGEDTTYQIKLSMTEKEFQMLSKEEISITVSCGDAYNLSQTIAKIGSVFKEHASAYAEMPLQIEAGGTYEGMNNNANIQYYGALYGSVDITEKDRLAVSVRSNTFSSQGGNNNNSITRLEYTGENLELAAGNIVEMNEFMMDGYGGKLAYKWKEKNSINLYGVAKSRTGNYKTFGANLNYALRDNVMISEEVSANLDAVEKLNSGIAKQKLFVKFGEKAKLDLFTGVSMEYSEKDADFKGKNPLMGSSMGYNFAYGGNKLNIQSSVIYNSNAYAGTFKGQRAQNHDARLLFGRFLLGGFYEYSFRKQTYFSDTTLVTDAFNTETHNYGARTGYSHKSTSILFSAGRQTQRLANDGASSVTTYDYLSMGNTFWFGQKMFLNLNAYAAYGTATGYVGPKVFVSSTQATLQVKFLGMAARYDNGPFYYTEFINYISNPQKYERILLSPYAEASLFKKQLNVRVQYNHTSTSQDDVKLSSVVMNVAYTNTKHGYDFNVNGVVPASKVEGGTSTYLNASFRMRLVSPCVAVKKYSSARIILFKDENSNGIKDKNEEVIEGQQMTLNGNMFVSDADGTVQVKNTSDTLLKGDLGYTSKVKGWAPVAGSMQDFAGSGTQYVPFRRCKILQGKVSVTKDSTSNLKFSIARIKVIVKGSDNSTYSTITDENGEFYFNLPTDNYTVMLAEAAFDENFRPADFSQSVDLTNNQEKTVYFEVKQKKRTMNIKKK